jgi:threonine/homoserine/homoserine lactone efflux protein
MRELSQIVAFAAAALVLVAVPGPAIVYLVTRSIADGRDVVWSMRRASISARRAASGPALKSLRGGLPQGGLPRPRGYG